MRAKLESSGRAIELAFSDPIKIPGEDYTIDLKTLRLIVNYADDDHSGRVQKAIVLDNVILPLIADLLAKSTEEAAQ